MAASFMRTVISAYRFAVSKLTNPTLRICPESSEPKLEILGVYRLDVTPEVFAAQLPMYGDEAQGVTSRKGNLRTLRVPSGTIATQVRVCRNKRDYT